VKIAEPAGYGWVRRNRQRHILLQLYGFWLKKVGGDWRRLAVNPAVLPRYY
jgi:hypothetical protein